MDTMKLLLSARAYNQPRLKISNTATALALVITIITGKATSVVTATFSSGDRIRHTT